MELPQTNHGVTFSEGATPGTVHVKGTSDGWAYIAGTVTVQAGDYMLACDGAKVWDYGVQAGVGDTGLNAPSSTTPVTGPLAEGDCQCSVFVAKGQTVDTDLTPRLYKLD